MEFLLVSIVLVFLSYSGIEYWALLTTHQQASHLANRYLERMSMEGRLSLTDEAELLSNFNNIGLTVENIEAQKESQGEVRILRNPGDIAGSTLKLRVTAQPDVPPLWVGALIGGNKLGEGYRVVVGGEILSERIYP